MIGIIIDILLTVLFAWLFIKGIGLAFRITWSAAKVFATILMVVALPALICCLIFAGGVVLLIPVALAAGALGLLKLCG